MFWGSGGKRGHGGGLGGGVPPPLMIPAASFEHPSISYIDLDIRPSDTPDSR